MKKAIAIVVIAALLVLCSCSANIMGKELFPLDSGMKRFAVFEDGQMAFEAVGGQPVTDLYIALSEASLTKIKSGEAEYKVDVEMINGIFEIAVGEECIQYEGVWYKPDSDAVLRFLQSCLTE